MNGGGGRCLAVAAVLALVADAEVAARADERVAGYATEAVSFSSGELRIQAVLGRPRGEGPFPAYISNHGSMTVQEASRGPWTSITPDSLPDVLARNGYVVLVVARRGYRGSEGTTTTYSTDPTSKSPYRKLAVDVIRGAETEAADVVAALDYLSRSPYVDPDRVAVGGFSLGGLVSVIAAARAVRFRALVSKAGGYHQGNPERGGADEAWPLVRDVWRRSAPTIEAATLILWARNDTTVDVELGRDLEQQLKKAGKPVDMKVYPAFGDNDHRLFGRREGYALFVPDVLQFLDRHLKP